MSTKPNPAAHTAAFLMDKWHAQSHANPLPRHFSWSTSQETVILEIAQIASDIARILPALRRVAREYPEAKPYHRAALDGYKVQYSKRLARIADRMSHYGYYPFWVLDAKGALYLVPTGMGLDPAVHFCVGASP